MKKPFIFITHKGDFTILWIWKVAFIYCKNIEDSRKIGLWTSKRGILFFINKHGIGIGHSFDTIVKGYE